MLSLVALDKESFNWLSQNDLTEMDSFAISCMEYDQVYSGVRTGKVDGVVYSTSKGFNLAKQLNLSEELVPSFVVGNEEFLGHFGIEHEFKLNTKKKQILKEIFEVIEETSRVKELWASQTTYQFLSHFLQTSKFENEADFIKNAFSSIDETFQPRSIYWLSAGDYEYYVRQMWKVQSLSGKALNANPEFHAFQGSTPESLSDLLQKLQGDLVEFDSISEVTCVDGGHDVKDRTFVLPVKGVEGFFHGHILVVSPKSWPYSKSSDALNTLCRTVAMNLELLRKIEETKNQSYIDDVTELFNQRYLDKVLDKEIERSKRTGCAFSVLFIDVDHFKRVNDSEGHLVGSNVLGQLGRVLNRAIRNTDYGFRYGGDEFLLVLVGMDATEATESAERIRHSVENSVFRVDGVDIRVTLSIGVSSFPEHAKTKEKIVRLADEAMYYGKNKSRNIVYVAS